MSLVFDLMLHYFGTKNIFWYFFIIIFILSVIAYKLGFARELPLLKSVFVYFLLFIGTFITTLFAVLKLPIIESLVIICIILGIYRFRLHLERKAR